MKKDKIQALFFLHILLMVYSCSSIFSKLAAEAAPGSLRFFLCYGGAIGLLGVYAIGWQQIIKHLPLTTAFANKAVTVVWGIIWGVVFFRETITPGRLIGAAMVVAGVVCYSLADGGEGNG